MRSARVEMNCGIESGMGGYGCVQSFTAVAFGQLWKWERNEGGRGGRFQFIVSEMTCSC